MNNLIEELLDIAKLPFNEISKDFKLVVLSDKVLHISNFLKILDYSNERIEIKVKKTKNIAIVGENLQICQINKKELIIKGHICSMELGEINEKKK